MVQWLHITLLLCRAGSQYARRFYLYKKLPLTQATNNVMVWKCEIINLLIAFECLNKWVHLKPGWNTIWGIKIMTLLSPSQKLAQSSLLGPLGQLFSNFLVSGVLYTTKWCLGKPHWSIYLEPWETRSATVLAELCSVKLSRWRPHMMCLWSPWKGLGVFQGS